MKAKPVIALILGCLVMIITGHNILPHHHHTGSVKVDQECLDHSASEHSGDHAGESHDPASHCHAFNGLDYVHNSKKEYDAKLIIASVNHSLLHFIFTDNSLPREVNFDCSGGAPPEFEGFLGESAGLRAPPVIS